MSTPTTTPPCQVVWLIHESKTRLVLPFSTKLRQLGYPSDLHFTHQPPELFLHRFSPGTHTLVVFYSYEDYLYAKDVWSWETQATKPVTKVTSLEDVLKYQLEHTSFCCIHDHSNEGGIEVPSEVVGGVDRLRVVTDEAALVALVTQQGAEREERGVIQEQQQQQTQQSACPLLKSLSLSSLETVPGMAMAARVVVIRHAQRLDEVHSTWSALASRPQDSPLSALGEQQSRWLGRWLARQPWANNGQVPGVFVSPFVRTVQTAHFALEEMQRCHREMCGCGASREDEKGEGGTCGCEESMTMVVECGLAEGAPWMAHTADSKTSGLCQTPWHLEAADLLGVSSRIDLRRQSLKTPLFSHGPSYPGRPVEAEVWYDRCAQAAWRLALLPEHAGGTLLLVTHGGCVDNIVHALSGRHLPGMPPHSCVTSLLLDPQAGRYHVEAVPSDSLRAYDQSPPEELASGEVEQQQAKCLVELLLSQHHLPEAMRTGRAVA